MNLRLAVAATALISTLATTGCVNGPKLVTPDPPPIPDGGPAVPSGNQTVLDPGQQVVADTAAGHIKIEAGPGTRRVFDWDGLRRGAIIKPRDKPFAGGDSKGIHFDGAPKIWQPADGITTLRYEEGRRDFDNVDDAMIWMQIRRLYYAYNDHGLVIGWKRDGDTLHAELWQFTIDGSKPNTLPDSENAHIAKGPLEAKPQKMYPHLVFADGHTEPYTTNNADEYKGAAATASSRNARAGGAANKPNWFRQHIAQPIANLFGGGQAHSTDSPGSSSADDATSS